MNIIKILGFLTLLLGLISFSFSSVEVFTKYDTYLKINSDNIINIEKQMTLKNVYDVGIVPGQIEFKIGKGTEGSVANIEVLDVLARDSFGNKIASRVRETKDFTVIILDIYYPLLPGFEYAFELNYNLSYESGGIFFKSFQIPLRESTIPIKSGLFTVELPNNNYFTYSHAEGKTASINKNIATWEIIDDEPKSIIFEYSWIPIRIASFKGSYIFWITINVIILLFIIYEIKREINRYREEMKGEE